MLPYRASKLLRALDFVPQIRLELLPLRQELVLQGLSANAGLICAWSTVVPEERACFGNIRVLQF